MLKKQPKIAPVANNEEKGLSYSLAMKRHKKAIDEGFYFEALLIEYALMEDRLRSFLYHVGMLNQKCDTKGFKRTESEIMAMLRRRNPKASSTSVRNISAKVEVVRAMLDWYASIPEAPKESAYLCALWCQFGSRIDVDEVSSTLSRLDEWCDYRNEIIHALMNKDPHAVEEGIPRRCEQGMAIVRELDKYVKQIKYRNLIRRAIRLKTE